MNDLTRVDSTDVALLSTALVPEQVYRPGGIEDIVSKLERDVREQAAELDISTPKGRRAVASLAHKVARSKTALDDMGKDLTEEIRLKKNAVDADRRALRERLDALKDEVRKPLDDYEAAEEQRVANHESALRQVDELAAFQTDPTLPMVDDRLRQLADIMQRNWQEFAKRADKAQADTEQRLRVTRQGIEAAIAEEAERQRLAAEAAERRRQQEEQARQEREARIAAEAAERARKQAEEIAEWARREAAEKVERERLAAERKATEERAAAEAERLRIEPEAKRAAETAQRERERLHQEREAADRRAAEAERQRREEAEEAARARDRALVEAAEKAEREREAAIKAERDRRAEEDARAQREADLTRLADERRAANIAHRRKVNQSIVAALAICGLTEELSQAVIAAVVREQVPNMRVTY